MSEEEFWQAAYLMAMLWGSHNPAGEADQALEDYRNMLDSDC